MGETLERVSDAAVQAIPAAEFIGLTMMVDGSVGTYVFTHPEAAEIDRAQYQSGRGPCVDAFATGNVHVIESTDSDERWPEFCRTARSHGILSTVSVPMSVAGKTLGAMNLYARVVSAFDHSAVVAATTFALQAGFVLANAQAYWDARTLNENLTAAMETRATIEQAKGIIMAAQRVSADEAFATLIAQSQHENIKLRDIATRIVSNAARRPG